MKVTLYKKNVDGSQQVWSTHVEGNKATSTWGKLGGKMQTQVDTYTEGKNIGRANETTPAQQCLLEVESEIAKKRRQGYNETIEGQGTKIPLPMLAKVYADHVKKLSPKVFISPKLDGQRCVLDLKTGKLWSRTGKEIFGVPHIAEQAAKVHLPGVQFLDGELYKHGMSFEEISSYVRKTKSIKPGYEVMEYHVFDVIKNVPYRERLSLIRQIKAKSIIPVETIFANQAEIQKHHAEFVAKGYEGTMVRIDTDSDYMIGKRTHELLKKKDFLDEEFKVDEFQKEKLGDTLGTCWCVTKDGVRFKATPAMSDAQKLEMWKNPKKYIGRMATVKFQNWTSSSDADWDGESKPRFGVLQRFRDIVE